MRFDEYTLEGLAAAEANELSRFRRVFHTYTLEFASIAAGGISSKSVQIQTDAIGGFVVGNIAADALVNATVGSYTAGTIAIPRDAYQSADDTAILPTLAELYAQISLNNVVWNAQRIPLTHFTGLGHAPAFFDVRPRVGAGETLTVTLYNETAVAVLPRVSFIGFKLYGKG